MDELRDLKRKFILGFGLLLFTFVSGVVGYMVIEGKQWSLLDAVYMTVITLGTIGYGETHPLSEAGRVFTVFLVLAGMSAFVYGITTITAFFVEGELGGYLRRKKMLAKIQALKDHYIICGAGEVGKHVIDELEKTGRTFVVIENKMEHIERLKQKEQVYYIIGDAHDDNVLLSSGIKKAKGLISALPSDQDNLFVVITARSLNPDLRIVSRCVDDRSSQKIVRAGANSVVSTNAIGGMRLASEMLRPSVVTFLDKMLRGPTEALRIEEIQVKNSPALVGKALKDLDISNKTGMIVVAIASENTTSYEFNPKSTYEVAQGDVLIVMGTSQQIVKFRELFKL